MTQLNWLKCFAMAVNGAVAYVEKAPLSEAKSVEQWAARVGRMVEEILERYPS